MRQHLTNCTRRIVRAYVQATQKAALACRVRSPKVSELLLATFPDLNQRLDSCHCLTREQCIAFLVSGLFAPEYYQKANPDVRAANLDPLEHFLRHGLMEGRNPNPIFHSSWYLDQNPDVRRENCPAFLHYFLFGRHEERSGSPYLDSKFYLQQYPNLKARGVDPLAHYLLLGGFRGARPNPHFDSRWYLKRYKDRLGEAENPLVHYIERGVPENLRPSPTFDPDWYTLFYGYDLESKSTPLIDLLQRPVWERRQGTERALEVFRCDQATSLGSDFGSNKKLRLTLGIVTYCSRARDLTRLWNSITLASKNLPKCYEVSIRAIENGKGSTWPEEASPIIDHQKTVGNCGFGQGHNLMMKSSFKSGADFYLALNPDGFLHPDSLSALLAMSKAHGHKALIEASQFPQEHPKCFDFQTFETPWASGACLLISRYIYEEIGGFDPNFFMYCEDVDYSWMAHRAEIKVLTCPRAIFFHDMSRRSTTDGLLTRFLQSGLYLGQKWGSSAFCDGIERTAHAHNLALKESPAPSNIYKLPKNATFDFGFSFAPVRWQVQDESC